MMKDEYGYKLIIYRQVFFAEIGYVDGNGIGIWQMTEESLPHKSQADAEFTRDQWLEQGRLIMTPWGEYRPSKSSYGAFRIRRAERRLSETELGNWGLTNHKQSGS